MTEGTLQYYPDGKGGYIGIKDSAPGAGDTVLYSPDGLAAGGGRPGVGDTIVYSPDGRGGYIGTSPGDSRGLWYWVSNGSNPKDWPTGTDPGWVKTLLMKEWNGVQLKFLLDPFSGDYTPHIFWKEHPKIIHYYRSFSGEWVSEEVPIPPGYEVSYYYSVDIGENNGAIYIAAQLIETGASNFDPDVPKPLYIFKKISTAAPPNPAHWTSSKILDTTLFHWYRVPSVKVAPSNNLGRVVYDEFTGRGLMEIREQSDLSWSYTVIVGGPHNWTDCIYPKIAVSDQGKSSVAFVNLRSYFGPTLGELEVYEKAEGGTWTRKTKDPPGGGHWINNLSNSGKYNPFFFGSWEEVYIPILHEGEFRWPNTPEYLSVRESYVCTLITTPEDPNHSLAGWTDDTTYSPACDFINAHLASSWWRWGWDYYTYQYLLLDDGVLDYAYFDLQEGTYYPIKGITSGVRAGQIGIDGTPLYWSQEYIDGHWIQTTHPAKCHLVFFRG